MVACVALPACTAGTVCNGAAWRDISGNPAASKAAVNETLNFMLLWGHAEIKEN